MSSVSFALKMVKSIKGFFPNDALTAKGVARVMKKSEGASRRAWRSPGTGVDGDRSPDGYPGSVAKAGVACLALSASSSPLLKHTPALRAIVLGCRRSDRYFPEHKPRRASTGSARRAAVTIRKVVK